MVWRERSAQVSFMSTIAQMLAAAMNQNERLFAPMLQRYAAEIMQEGYNAHLLQQRAQALRNAQQGVRKKRLYDVQMLDRLTAMGDYYDQELGADLKPVPKGAKKRKR